MQHRRFVSSVQAGGAGFRRGQTMLELIVAIFIILTALGGIATMVTMSVRGQRTTEQTVIAYQLAREGIEVARALRDNAFTTGTRPMCQTICSTLPSGQTGGGDHNGTTELDPTTGSWNLNYGGSVAQFNSTGNRICRSAAIGAYYQRQAGCLSGDSYTSTGYRRRLTVDFICLNPADNTECVATGGTGCPGTAGCTANHTQFIGHRVTSRVWMPNRGCGAPTSVTGCVDLEDYLYAWK